VTITAYKSLTFYTFTALNLVHGGGVQVFEKIQLCTSTKKVDNH